LLDRRTRVTGNRRVRIEADGGSRGNPGPAGFGAVLKDAETGEVIAEAAESIGLASNNVAEYRGLIAGLELYGEHTPGALLEVRMDSKLVIEQMAGRWKVKHENMRPLAATAARLAPFGTVWTWVPRAQNSHADRLANLAMDAAARGEAFTPAAREPAPAPGASVVHPLINWSGLTGTPTKLILLRHGETRHTTERRFSGPGGEDPGLIPSGEEQARRAARVISDLGGIDALVSSPLRRTRETAEFVAASLGLPVQIDEGFQECGFGAWDGLTYKQVEERWPDELSRWLGSTAVRPPGGESVDDVRRRVETSLNRTVGEHRGQTVVVVSHVTPIKLVLRYCLEASWQVTHHLLVAPGSLTTMWFYESGATLLRHFSVVP
jgi:probable phosphoglycerate mutase